MPSRRAHYYRQKADECRIHAAAAKQVEVEESWHKLAAQWERLARGLDATGRDWPTGSARSDQRAVLRGNRISVVPQFQMSQLLPLRIWALIFRSCPITILTLATA